MDKASAAGRRVVARVLVRGRPWGPRGNGGVIQIDVDVPDRPGELGKLAAVLADAGVNINRVSGESGGGRAYLSLFVNEPTKARTALKAAGYEPTDRTILVVRLDDRPGALADLAKRLGAAGVNITSVIHLETVGGHAQLAIGVDDLAKARGLV